MKIDPRLGRLIAFLLALTMLTQGAEVFAQEGEIFLPTVSTQDSVALSVPAQPRQNGDGPVNCDDGEEGEGRTQFKVIVRLTDVPFDDPDTEPNPDIPGSTLDDDGLAVNTAGGEFVSDSEFCLPTGVSSFEYRQRNGNIWGPSRIQRFFKFGEKANTSEQWDVPFSDVSVTLFNRDEILSEPHYLAVTNLGEFTTGDTFYVPPGAVTEYRLRSGDIWGPVRTYRYGATANDVPSGEEDGPNLEFATVTVDLVPGDESCNVNEFGYVIDSKVTVANTVDIPNAGSKPPTPYGDGDTFHMPPGVTVERRFGTGGILSPSQRVTVVAGDQTWTLEFASVRVTLQDGKETGEDLFAPHFARIGGLDYTTGDCLNVPPIPSLTYQLGRTGDPDPETGQIAAIVQGLPQRLTLPPIEYEQLKELKAKFATVSLGFDLSGGSCELATEVRTVPILEDGVEVIPSQYITTVPDGGTVHLPPTTPTRLIADVCGYRGAPLTRFFAAADASFLWSMSLATP